VTQHVDQYGANGCYRRSRPAIEADCSAGRPNLRPRHSDYVAVLTDSWFHGIRHGRAGEFRPGKSRPPAANPDGRVKARFHGIAVAAGRCVEEFYGLEKHGITGRILSGRIAVEINAILGSSAPRDDSMESTTGRISSRMCSAVAPLQPLLGASDEFPHGFSEFAEFCSRRF
jgi:hypothetical protein